MKTDDLNLAFMNLFSVDRVGFGSQALVTEAKEI